MVFCVTENTDLALPVRSFDFGRDIIQPKHDGTSKINSALKHRAVYFSFGWRSSRRKLMTALTGIDIRAQQGLARH
jgi:hypothetical protein